MTSPSDHNDDNNADLHDDRYDDRRLHGDRRISDDDRRKEDRPEFVEALGGDRRDGGERRESLIRRVDDAANMASETSRIILEVPESGASLLAQMEGQARPDKQEQEEEGVGITGSAYNMTPSDLDAQPPGRQENASANKSLSLREVMIMVRPKVVATMALSAVASVILTFFSLTTMAAFIFYAGFFVMPVFYALEVRYISFGDHLYAMLMPGWLGLACILFGLGGAFYKLVLTAETEWEIGLFIFTWCFMCPVILSATARHILKPKDNEEET